MLNERAFTYNQYGIHKDLRLEPDQDMGLVRIYMYVNGRIGSARSYVSANPKVKKW